MEHLPAHVFNRFAAICDGSSVDVHQIVPAACQVAAGGDLDDGAFSQAVGRAAPGGEDVQIHTGGQLQRAANEVAGGGGGVGESLLFQLFTRCKTPVMAEEPDFTIEPIAFSTMLDKPPFLLPGVVLALRSTLPRCR